MRGNLLDNQAAKFVEDLVLSRLRKRLQQKNGLKNVDSELNAILHLLSDLEPSSTTGFKGVSIEITSNKKSQLYFLATKAKSANNSSIALRFSIEKLGIREAFHQAVLKRAEFVSHSLFIELDQLMPPTAAIIYKEVVSKKGLNWAEKMGIAAVLSLHSNINQ